jgi:hypothetical protein
MNARCVVTGCEARAGKAGYCRSHVFELGYELADCGHSTPCWMWLGFINNVGYGRFGNEYAHRASYERHRGPIPKGMQPDHLCGVSACINPEHMEVVTPAVNVARGGSPGAIAVRTNACMKGHEYTPDNTYVRPDGKGRHCRTCMRERWRAA